MSERKLVNIRIDVGILADFDAWCKEHGTSRTNALEQYMLRQVSNDQVRKILKPAMTANNPLRVAKEAAAKKADVAPADCAHPAGMRITGVCMVCGKDVGERKK